MIFGFHDLRFRETNIPKTIFRNLYGHYNLLVIYLELTNSPSFFIDSMKKMFKLYLDSFVIIFIDDIFLYQRNRSKNKEYLRIVLKTLRDQ